MTMEEDEEEGEGDEEKQDQASQEEDKNIMNCIRILRFLQLLCEGHHAGL